MEAGATSATAGVGQAVKRAGSGTRKRFARTGRMLDAGEDRLLPDDQLTLIVPFMSAACPGKLQKNW